MSSPCLARVHSPLPIDARQCAVFNICKGVESITWRQLITFRLATHLALGTVLR